MDNIRPKWPFVGTNFPFLAILASQVRVRVRVVTIFIIVVDASPLFTRLHVRFYLMKQSLTHPRRPRGSQSGRKRRDESLQVRGKEPLGTDSHRTTSTKKSGCRLLIGHKKFSYVQITIITVKSKSAWDVQSHSLHVKVLDFAPFVDRTWGKSSSHSNSVSRFIKITYANNLHVKILDFVPFTIRT